MTTSSFGGTFVEINQSGDILSVAPTTLDLVTRDDVTSFSYSINQIANNFFGSLAIVDIAADFLNLVINGAVYTQDTVFLDTLIAEVNWGGNKTSIVMIVTDENTSTDSYALFTLSGDPVPLMNSVAEIQAFDASVTAIQALTSGPFGPGVDIPFNSLLNFSASELDQIFGTEQHDTFVFSQAADHYNGNGGDDTVDYTDATGRVLADLQIDQVGSSVAGFFSAGAGQGDTYASIENLIGGAFADNLRGDAQANDLQGGGVSDRLYGRSGDDTLNGGTGADALYGNLGVDVMTGGPDDRADRFIYFNMVETGVGAGNRDIITDFQTGIDRIEIRRFDADTTQGGRQGFNFIADAAFSNTAGELRFEQTGGNTIVQGDVNGDGLADFEIELTGTMTLVEGDFLI